MTQQWNETSLNAFVRIQSAISDSSWGGFMAQILEQDKSLQYESNVSLEALIQTNIDIILQQDPTIFFTIAKSGIDSPEPISFSKLELISTNYPEQNITWWPANFDSYEKCAEWVNTTLKQQYAQ